MMNRMEKTKLYDICKVILVLLVVFAHASRMYTGDGVYTPVNNSFTLSLMTAIIYSFHMPAFFWISGCIYGYQIERGKYIDWKRFLLKKAKNLLIPYAVFGILLVAPTMVLLGLTDDSYWKYVVDGILFAHNSRHLWYVLALFWIFVLASVLRKILTNRSKWCMTAVIIVSLLISISDCFPETFQLSSAAEYWVYFVGGIYFNRYADKIVSISSKRFLLIFLIGGLLFLSLRTFFYNVVLRYLFALAGVLVLVSFVILMADLVTKNDLYKRVLSNSYGIYLFHPMIIYIMYAASYQKNIHPWLLCGFISIAALCCSMWCTIALRHTKLRFLVGVSSDR